MNIFVLHKNSQLSTMFHHNRHIVKMPLETAQMLSTGQHVLLGKKVNVEKLYRKTHENHGCNVWIRESLSNYIWLCEYGVYLCEEYKFRYSREHAARRVIDFCLKNPLPIIDKGVTPFYQAIKPQYKLSTDGIENYRNFYCAEKLASFNKRYQRWDINSWKNRSKPYWIEKNQHFNQLYTLGLIKKY